MAAFLKLHSFFLVLFSRSASFARVSARGPLFSALESTLNNSSRHILAIRGHTWFCNSLLCKCCMGNVPRGILKFLWQCEIWVGRNFGQDQRERLGRKSLFWASVCFWKSLKAELQHRFTQMFTSIADKNASLVPKCSKWWREKRDGWWDLKSYLAKKAITLPSLVLKAKKKTLRNEEDA